MKNPLAIIAIILIIGVIGVGWYMFSSTNNSSTATPTPQEEYLVPTASQSEIQDTSSDDRYFVYSQEGFENAGHQRRVLFFYAAWCPTCRPADVDFSNNEHSLPDDVALFRVNYDTEAELKSKYGITYQHTFVQVDENGNEITKWNGGAVEQLKKNII
jgi:thiol-disulfide isomerase/thioredoxin